MNRIDGRRVDQLRETRIIPGYQSFAEGSALIEMGQTKVICSASIEERVPPWLRGQGRGWVTAEYSMLPRSTLTRNSRESATGRVKGRHQEIQRLIGRALRPVTDLTGLGERMVVVDCDVLQADGGTRTAAITGAYVALYQAFHRLRKNGGFKRIPLRDSVAAVSVGIVGDGLLLDLCYEEDYRADVDFNVAMTGSGHLVEIQASAEGDPFSPDIVGEAIALAGRGIKPLLQIQEEAIEAIQAQ